MMNNMGRIGIVVFLFILSLTVIIYATRDIKPIVNIGDVWGYPVKTPDPFKKYESEKNRVIDIKGDYVQYIRNDKDTCSTNIRTFVFNSKKIK